MNRALYAVNIRKSIVALSSRPQPHSRITIPSSVRLATGMNLRFSTWAVAMTSTSAWTQRYYSPMVNQFATSACVLQSAVSSTEDDSKLATTIPPSSLEGTTIRTPPSLTREGKVVADGHVVSSFLGGLIAVRVDDDFTEVIPSGTPLVVTPTNPLQKENTKSSLGGDLIGRQVKFPNGHIGVVVSHRPPIAFVYTDIEDAQEIDGKVQVLDSLASVDVDESKKVVDCFGRSLVGDDVVGTLHRPMFAPIPKVSDIALINTPLLTGITMFDALAPIGKGQNMLLIGHNIVEMRQYVRAMLTVQVGEGTKCIYASTADNDNVTQMLAEAGLSKDVTLVLGKQSDQHVDGPSVAAEATVTAATACAIAESLALNQGADTLVVVDTLDYHKSLWDATTRVLVDVFGIDAVVKSDRDGGASSEMRGFFSSIIQRSAQYNEKKGGGSVTLVLLCTIPKMATADEDATFTLEDFASSPAKVKDRIDFLVKRNLPLTVANLRKIQIPIPTDADGNRRLALQHVDDLISMSDGQIWLDEELEAKGRRPAMDFQRSVTRIGIGADTESRADAAAIRHVVEGLRLDLSQALDLGGADLGTKASKNQARNALGWLLAMHQPSTGGVRKLSESCTALLAASKGYLGGSLDDGAVAGTIAGDELMAGLLEHVKSTAVDALDMVDATHDMTEENQEAIEAAIKSYFLSSTL